MGLLCGICDAALVETAVDANDLYSAGETIRRERYGDRDIHTTSTCEHGKYDGVTLDEEVVQKSAGIDVKKKHKEEAHWT